MQIQDLSANSKTNKNVIFKSLWWIQNFLVLRRLGLTNHYKTIGAVSVLADYKSSRYPITTVVIRDRQSINFIWTLRKFNKQANPKLP